MVTFFVGDGRLGNQIFQYVAIHKIRGTTKLLSPSLRSLQNVFQLPENVRIWRIPANIEKIIRRVLVPVLARPLFKWLRLGVYCTEPMTRMPNGSSDPGGEMTVQRGLLPITFIDGGFYQNLSDALTAADFRQLKIRDDVLARAREVICSVMAGRPWPGAVMHVRRGDYVGYSAYGLDSILLQADYFHRAARTARLSMEDHPEILVVTDDPEWCERELAALKPFTVVSVSEAIDFALLSMFPVSILSNSTFSLAAACIGTDVKRVIGPEFWFGHAVNQWYPPKIRSIDPRFEYV